MRKKQELVVEMDTLETSIIISTLCEPLGIVDSIIISLYSYESFMGLGPCFQPKTLTIELNFLAR